MAEHVAEHLVDRLLGVEGDRDPRGELGLRVGLPQPAPAERVEGVGVVGRIPISRAHEGRNLFADLQDFVSVSESILFE